VGPLECNIKIQDGIVQNLSEQYLVSCNSSGWGCGGGWWAHDYHISWPDECDSSGAVMEADFPYVANDAPCGCPYPHPYELTDWAYIGSSGSVPDVDAMKQAIMDYGPISVGIYASNAMKAYNGGIFNSCETGTINHGVTIVGWQDMFGSGVWIVRNSWGSGWGEGGYMRIPYYCNDVGYGASYVVYDGGLGITADTTYGDAPLEVAFEASSGLEVDTWSWEFGDGGSDDQQSCVHTYTAPGMYTVTAEISAGGDIRSREFENFIIVLADTLCSVGDSGRAGEQVVVPLYVCNHAPLSGITIPLQMTGDFVPRLDSISTATGREASLDTISFVNWDSNHGRYTFTLSPADPTQPGLAPGSGPVAYLYLTLPLTAQAGQTVDISTSGYSIYEPEFSWPRFAYTPKDGGNATITVSSCCIGMTGNVDGSPDDLATISDLTKMVNHLFITFESLPCPAEANMNGDPEGNVDISDLQTLVDYLFISFWDMAYCQ
jgi:PKD repeat protein